jgi:hypothetical protein
MLHVDVKKVGRIPDGGGWAIHERGTDEARASRRVANHRLGHVYIHAAGGGSPRCPSTNPPLFREAAPLEVSDGLSAASALLDAVGVSVPGCVVVGFDNPG